MNRIKNHTELVAERIRIETSLKFQKEQINIGIQEFKEKLHQFEYLLPILEIFKKKQVNNSIWKAIYSLGMDILLNQGMLSKSTWITKIIAPLILKSLTKTNSESVTNNFQPSYGTTNKND